MYIHIYIYKKVLSVLDDHIVMNAALDAQPPALRE